MPTTFSATLDTRVLDAIVAGAPEKLEGALDKIAGDVLASALPDVPVDTGALRASGHVETPEPGVRLIVFSMRYAAFVELGHFTRRDTQGGPRWVPAQPYLYPAMLAIIGALGGYVVVVVTP